MLPKPFCLLTSYFSLLPREMHKPKINTQLKPPPFPNSTALINQHLSILFLNISYVHLSLSPYSSCSSRDHNYYSPGLPQGTPNYLSVFSLGPSNHSANYVERIWYIQSDLLYSWQVPTWSGPDYVMSPTHFLDSYPPSSLNFILQPHWKFFTTPTQNSLFSSFSLAVSFSSFGY